jgi:arylsulfatase A-like enzyme
VISNPYRIAFYLLVSISFVNAEQRPNVLFIAIDDLNTSPEGFNGETTVHTPHLTRLANKGVRFTNAHCAAPACNPSRASVMTGLAPATSGVYLNSQDWRVNQVMMSRTNLPQHFKNNGYLTLGGGKLYHAASLSEGMHEGYLDARPWDAYYPSKTQQLPDEVEPAKIPMNGSSKQYRGYMDWAPLDIETDEMADAKVVSWAEKHLSQTHEKPLFLAVGIYRPHIPWWTPKEYFERNPIEDVVLPRVIEDDLDDVPEAGRAMRKQGWHQWMLDNDKWKEAVQGYNASVSFTDDMVGRLLTALENGPMADNTIVVLWTDHGYHLGQKEHWEKFALWEQTTRVPLIIAAPGEFAAGKDSSEPVSLLDIYPTLNELCGIPLSTKLDGVSLVPLLEDPSTDTGRAVVCTQDFNNHAIRSDRWRYIRYADGSEELYDQLEDPENFYNLVGKKQSDSVKQELATWLPEHNAEPHPTFNGQKAMNDKYEAEQLTR